MAGSSTIGLGIGVIILLALWIFTAFSWIILSRSKSSVRLSVTVFSVFVTTVLFILPKGPSKDPEVDYDEKPDPITLFEDLEPPDDGDDNIYDYLFILRVLLILGLVFSLLFGFAINISEFWTLKVHGTMAPPKRKLPEHFK